MSTQASTSDQIAGNGKLALDLEPDIHALGIYLAQQRGMTFNDFLEYLITKEAAKGKYFGL